MDKISNVIEIIQKNFNECKTIKELLYVHREYSNFLSNELIRTLDRICNPK